MGFWRFQEPSLKHLHVMLHESLGIDPDGSLKADEDRRKGKAELLREFTNDDTISCAKNETFPRFHGGSD